MDITLNQAANLSDAITEILFTHSNLSTVEKLAIAEEALLTAFDIIGVESIDGKTIEEYENENEEGAT